MVIFIFWFVFIPLEQKKKLKSLKKVCHNNYFCNILMPSEGTKKSGINQYKKSDKAAFTIYADLEY